MSLENPIPPEDYPISWGDVAKRIGKAALYNVGDILEYVGRGTNAAAMAVHKAAEDQKAYEDAEVKKFRDQIEDFSKRQIGPTE